MKITYLVGLAIVTALTGCAPKAIQEECTMPLGVAQPVDDGHKVLGISLGQPLTLPECKRNYYGAIKEVCYKRSSALVEVDKCPALGDEFVFIEFPSATKPDWVVGSVLANLVNGRVERVSASTLGIVSQESDFDVIASKYGKPKSKIYTEGLNAHGAKFKILSAEWEHQDVTVTLHGAISKIDDGQVDFVTDTMMLYIKEKEKSADAKKIKL